MKIRLFPFILLAILFLTGAGKMKKKADLIITNAVVYTVDDVFSKTECFAVVNGKIAATGPATEIFEKYASRQVIDADGKFVYPGFNDGHAHFNGYATNIIQFADLRATKSPEEIYSILQNHHKKFGGEWVLGRGWDQNDWENQEFPDKSKIDELYPDTPVYLIRVDGHAGWCNSKALEMAGITADTKVPGGQVVLKNGQPSGILIDNTMELVSGLIPEISVEQQQKGLHAAQKNCFAVGLTSVTDAGLNKETILLMEEMQGSSELKMRINAMLNPSEENYDYFVRKGPVQNERLTINT
ncbi:MAG TPA: amidohydrolase family protein, partial [Prolixibacteraceae bacterium]|nr:amidohydrolase family protein [Prolixibacteraceae bacterium]